MAIEDVLQMMKEDFKQMVKEMLPLGEYDDGELVLSRKDVNKMLERLE